MFFPILNLSVEDRTDHGILTNVSVEMVQQIQDPLVAADTLVKRVHDSSDSTPAWHVRCTNSRMADSRLDPGRRV